MIATNKPYHFIYLDTFFHYICRLAFSCINSHVVSSQHRGNFTGRNKLSNTAIESDPNSNFNFMYNK